MPVVVTCTLFACSEGLACKSLFFDNISFSARGKSKGWHNLVGQITNTSMLD